MRRERACVQEWERPSFEDMPPPLFKKSLVVTGDHSLQFVQKDAEYADALRAGFHPGASGSGREQHLQSLQEVLISAPPSEVLPVCQSGVQGADRGDQISHDPSSAASHGAGKHPCPWLIEESLDRGEEDPGWRETNGTNAWDNARVGCELEIDSPHGDRRAARDSKDMDGALDMPWMLGSGLSVLPEDDRGSSNAPIPGEIRSSREISGDGSDVFDEFFERCSLGTLEELLAVAETPTPNEPVVKDESGLQGDEVAPTSGDGAAPGQTPAPAVPGKAARPEKRMASRTLWKCLYCGKTKMLSSLARDGRTRIRCGCGGKFADGQDRLHANWQQQFVEPSVIASCVGVDSSLFPVVR